MGRKLIYIFLLILMLILFTGKMLDYEAERVVNNLYFRDHDGIISGLQSVELKRGQRHALVLLHGFFESPQIFFMLIDDLKDNVKADIYAPTMPFQVRDLQTGANLKSDLVVKEVRNYLYKLSQKYQTITVVGLSFGGAVLTDLAEKNELPNNLNMILFAPAIYLKTNTFKGRLGAQAYGLWRKYCNYHSLGCKLPSYESGDSEAQEMMKTEKTLQYNVIPALLEMYKLDLANRQGFSDIQRPYSLIVAEDDNRVSYDKQKADCIKNKAFCTFYSFPSGKHLIHWGQNKKAVADLLIELINESLKPASNQAQP